MFVKFIQAETGARVQIKGRGSGFLENDTGRESDEPMHISVVAPTDDQIQRAKMLADDLLMVLRIEYDKARSSGNQGGGGVYQGQGNYGGGQQAQAGGDPYAGGYQQQGGAADASQAQAAAATGVQPGEGSSAEAWEQYRAYVLFGNIHHRADITSLATGRLTATTSTTRSSRLGRRRRCRPRAARRHESVTETGDESGAEHPTVSQCTRPSWPGLACARGIYNHTSISICHVPTSTLDNGRLLDKSKPRAIAYMIPYA